MLDTETVITSPAEVRRTTKGRRTEVVDPRTCVSMRDQGCEVRLYFESLAIDASLLEVRILPDHAPFEPIPIMPRVALYTRYARASMAMRDEDTNAVLRALRAAGATRRGHSPDFYKIVATKYKALTAEGEPHPIKALAKLETVDISTASRWVKEAKRRGHIKEENDAR